MHSNNISLPYQNADLHRIYEIDDEIQPDDHLSAIPLTTKINGITNSPESKMDYVVINTQDAGGYKGRERGWLKNVCIGGAILTGAGILLGVGYGSFIAGRRSASQLSEVTKLPQPTGIRSTTTPLPEILAEYTSPHKINSTISPYSYYEPKNKNSVVLNSTMQTTTNTIINKEPDKTTLKSTTLNIEILPTTETMIQKYKHENERNTYYDTVPKDKYYPLDKKMYFDITNFCNSEIQGIIVKAYQADPVMRCELMREISDKIYIYKSDETWLRDLYNLKETLTAEEHAEEILITRKLTALYLAAECIINKQDIDVFYHQLMADNKNKEHYSPEVLIKRYNSIMDYFPVHDKIGEC